MSLPLLITLLPSTDVDLGRWILSHHDVAYRERPHAPIFHILALKSWGAGKDGYPLMVGADGKTTYPGVEAILGELDPKAPEDRRLLPDKAHDPTLAQEVDALQRWARYDAGGAVVNWSYFHLLQYKSVVWPSLTTSVPWYEKLTCLVAFPVIRGLMYKGLKLDEAAVARALAEIHAAFDRVDGLLADGRTYLCGDRLTLADLAVAASFAPMVLAQGYHGMLPDEARCPVFMQAVYKDLRQRPTGQFIQRMYDTHRDPQVLQVG